MERRGPLGGGNGPSQNTERAGETETVGVGAMLQRRLMHQGADGEVGQQQTVDLLNHLARVLAAAWAGMGPLMHFDLVQGGLDGLVTNDKFCLTRRARVRLRWRGRGGMPSRAARG
jgi:hypothetical protein